MAVEAPIKLKEAARWSQGYPHQNAAWDWLQGQLSIDVISEFAARYRNQQRLIDLGIQASVPPQALEIIQAFEGFSSTPYRCSQGVATIGIGTTVYPTGKPVTLGDPPISRLQAIEYLDHRLDQIIAPALLKTVPFYSAMDQNQRAALMSFAYNLGHDFMLVSDGFDTIQRNLKLKDWQSIPETLKLYINPGTPSEKGLLRRRVAEGLLWIGEGEYAR